MGRFELSKNFSVVKKVFLLVIFLFISAVSCFYAFPIAFSKAGDKAADIIFKILWSKGTEDTQELINTIDMVSLKFLLTPYFLLGCALAFVVLYLAKLKDLRSYHFVGSLSRILFMYILLISIISMILVWLDITIRANHYCYLQIGYLWKTLFPMPPQP